MNTTLFKELKDCIYAEEMQPQDFCRENGLELYSTWKDICIEYGLSIPATASAREVLKQALKREQKPNAGAGAGHVQRVSSGNNDLAALIAAAVQPLIQQQAAPVVIDEAKIIDLIKQHAPSTVREINITVNDGPKTSVDGQQHEAFESILKQMEAGLHLYLYGEAGTGKTHIAETAAIALQKRYFCISVCAQSTKSDFLGFMNANGNYVTTGFREAYEGGGVFLIDEIDNGNPNILAVLNSALANGVCAFPDGMVKRHSDFICVACANTFGYGANRVYVGRNQIDAATLNRFVQTEIKYDEKLERELFGDIATDIQAIRAKLAGERVIISMRNISNAVKLMRAGYSKQEAIEISVLNTIPDNLRSKI